MDIYFGNRKLARTFNSEKELARAYGDQMARVIMTRLAVMRNASALAQVPWTPPERRHALAGRRKNQYAVDLVHPYRLVFRPAHNPVPLKSDGGVDMDKVTAVEILEVVDYH